MENLEINDALLVQNNKFHCIEVVLKTVTYSENVLDGMVHLEVNFLDKSKLDFDLPIILEETIHYGLPSAEWVINIPGVEVINIGVILAGSLLEKGMDFDEDLFLNPSLSTFLFEVA